MSLRFDPRLRAVWPLTYILTLTAAGAHANANAHPVLPPRLGSGQEARAAYPAGVTAGSARVVLELVVDAHGQVQSAAPVEVTTEQTKVTTEQTKVATAPSEPDALAFVEAAVTRARALRFDPAVRDLQPVAARIHFAFQFEPDAGAEPVSGWSESPPDAPAEPTAEPPPPVPPAAPVAAPSSVEPPATPAPGAPAIHVHPHTHSHPHAHEPSSFGAHAHVPKSAARAQASAASDFDIEIGALRAVPRRTAADYLTLAPGVVLVNHAGTGHAGGIFLRGFDAGEGQDLELRVDGIPLNEPSNAHSHGYADSQFLIPEVVERVRVLEGPFDPRQSDFAVAGSASYELGVRERGIRAQLGYGSFDERRALVLWAPTDAERGTFAGVDLRDGDGFGPNRAHSSFRALARYADDAGPLSYSILFGSHALEFDSAGVLRQDAFDRRELPCEREEDSQFFCVTDPQQGGSASRHLLSGKLAWGKPDRSFQLQAYGMLRNVRLRENFTGALLDSRGDGLDEMYEATSIGALGSYALTPKRWGLRQRFELGLEARHDSGETRMLRIRRTGAVPYQTVFDSELALTHVAAYVRGELNPHAAVSFRGGARVDGFAFSTLDRNQPAEDRVGPRLPLLARDAFGAAVSPRGSAVAHLTDTLDWTLAAGLGVRSSDAQALSEGEAAPFARVLSLETGPTARATLADTVALEARAFAFATRVSDDLVFDEARGRNIPVGPSNRYGASASARARVGRSHDTLASVTWAEAHQISRTDSIFAFGEGPRLPFVPRWVLRLDHASETQLQIGPERVQLGAALGFGWVGPQPLPLATESAARFQVDVALRARLRFLELGLSIENLFDRRNHAAELNYASHFEEADAPASRRSVRHFAAGAPRLWLLTLTAYLNDVATPATAEGDET